ncbi:MAG: hypothetical protein ABR524_12980, partial [Thermoanaerobaculia bacterium]
MRRFLLSTLSAILAVVLAGCVEAPSSGTASRERAEGDPVRIGFSMDTLKEERWQRDKRLVEQ